VKSDWSGQYSVPFAAGGGGGAGGVGVGAGGPVVQQHLWQQEPSSCLQVDGVAQEHSHTHEVQCFTVLEFRRTTAATGVPGTLHMHNKAQSARRESKAGVVLRITKMWTRGGEAPGGSARSTQGRASCQQNAAPAQQQRARRRRRPPPHAARAAGARRRRRRGGSDPAVTTAAIPARQAAAGGDRGARARAGDLIPRAGSVAINPARAAAPPRAGLKVLVMIFRTDGLRPRLRTVPPPPQR
jgi:hypothetical protein